MNEESKLLKEELTKVVAEYTRLTNNIQRGRLDLFAAAALTGILASPQCGGDKKVCSDAAWQMAQAMLDSEPKEP